MESIKRLFDLLDRWRHLPKYQLERRADIFFGLYLREFLQDRLGIALRPQLVPEFPIHLRSLDPDVLGDRSCNADYLAVSEDLSRVLLVELKTDGLSRRDRQDKYLVDAQSVGMTALLRGVVQIAGATQQKRKYLHLLALLADVGLVTLPADLDGSAAGKLCAKPEQIEVTNQVKSIDLVYLQPHKTQPEEIGFAELAQWMERFDDPLSVRFRQSLEQWALTTAGG
jgi:hypothetical protein